MLLESWRKLWTSRRRGTTVPGQMESPPTGRRARRERGARWGERSVERLESRALLSAIVVNPVTGLTTTEAGGAASFSVVLDSAPTDTVYIGARSDRLSEGRVPVDLLFIFTPENWNLPQQVLVTGADDNVADGNQTYHVILDAAISNDGNFHALDPEDVTLVNLDNDVAEIQVFSPSQLHTTEAGLAVAISVRLGSEPGSDVILPLSSDDVGEGVVSTNSLTFTAANWNISQVVTVTGVNDTLVDGTQTYRIVVGPASSSDPQYAEQDPADLVFQNFDDDVPNNLTLTLASGSMAESASQTATLVRAGDLTLPLEVSLSSSNPLAATVPNSVSFAPFQAVATFTVTGVDDSIIDGTQTAILTATGIDYPSAQAPLSVADDDFYADLIFTAISAVTLGGNDLRVSYTIQNIGNLPANLDGPTSAEEDNVALQMFLSADNVFDNAGDIPAGGRILGPSPLGLLGVGESYSGMFVTSAFLPVDTSLYPYLTLRIDATDVLGESNETNNTTATAIILPPPNRPPVFPVLGTILAAEQQLLSRTFQVLDPDGDFVFTLAEQLPPGASYDPDTRTLSWTPSEAQGSRDYQVKLLASDGRLTTTASYTIQVNEVNSPPVFKPVTTKQVHPGEALSFSVSATDADLPVQTLSYAATDLPAGATFHASTRTFRWTPSASEAPGDVQVTFQVHDGVTTSSQVVTITVLPPNTAPTFKSLGNKSLPEKQPFTLLVSATDLEQKSSQLVYSASNLPSGASFNPATRLFRWTPQENAGPGNHVVTFTVSDGSLSTSQDVTLTVEEVNSAPVLKRIGNKRVDYNQLLSFTITATDLDLPQNTLLYSATGLPAGAQFDPQTQTFTWIPSISQLGGNYPVLFRVSDGQASVWEEVILSVGGNPSVPVFRPMNGKKVNERATLSFAVSATDAETPASQLVYSAQNLPAGANFNPDTRVFSWMPTEAQGPADYTVLFRVRDTQGYVSSHPVKIQVLETNAPPTFQAISDREVVAGLLTTFTVLASDVDLPVNTLTYSTRELPPGATFDAATRTFSWTPTAAQANRNFRATFAVSDGSLTTYKTVALRVIAPTSQTDSSLNSPLADRSLSSSLIDQVFRGLV